LSSFNIHQLQFFIAAAETGSFSAAGRRLGRAQSGVSTAVANLEVDLGTKLFDRSRKYLRLTAEGEALLRDARYVVKSCERMQDRALSFSMDEETHIGIALDEALLPVFSQQVLWRFVEKYPFTEIDIQTGVFNDVESMVAKGEADIGLVIGAGIPKRLETYKLLSYIPFQAVVSQGHDLLSKDDVTLADLEGEKQIVVTSRGEEKDTEVTLFSGKRWLVDSYSACLSLVSQGYGWSFVPTCLLNSKELVAEVAPLSLELEVKEHTSPLYLVWSNTEHLRKAGKWLLNQLSEFEFSG